VPYCRDKDNGKQTQLVIRIINYIPLVNVAKTFALGHRRRKIYKAIHLSLQSTILVLLGQFCCWLHGPGIDSCCGRGRFSAPVQAGPKTHSVSCTIGTGSLTEVKRSGVGLTSHHHLAPRLNKEYSYTPPALGLHGLF